MLFGLFKRKKDDLELPPVEETTENVKEVVSEIPKIENLPVEESPKLEEMEKVETELSDLENLIPKDTLPSKNMTLENLCIKIDLESEDIERRIKEFKTMISKVDMNSSEIFDLLDLYSKAKTKLKEFLQEIDRFDAVGWGVDEETAAFYKFRACKSLAKIRKQMIEIEEFVKQSGFTPAKVEEILKMPAEKLVEQLANIKRSSPAQKPKKQKKK
ncbi:MAG: hypothetical protein QXO84_03440 [Candidatus Aenigmatarchaeota archaeon]